MKKPKIVIAGKKWQKCFTLVELLVVITVISVLVGLAMVSFGGAQKQARDTQRKSDLQQYRIALENYASVWNGFYPTADSAVVLNGDPGFCKTHLKDGGFIADCPEDPTNSSSNVYMYQSNSNGSYYRIYTDLETGNYWIVCSDGSSFGNVNVITSCFEEAPTD